MTRYNRDYGFVVQNIDEDGFPILKVEPNTAARYYQSDPLPIGSAPIIFRNGHRAYFAKHGIREKRADVLFDGATFIVKDHIRLALMALDLPTISIHPAVYIDDAGEWHEDYWFVAFRGFLDCVDRAKSRFMKPVRPDDTLAIGAYSLDESVLEAIPLHERLLFRMGGTDDRLVVCHRSLLELFRCNGVEITQIEDYKSVDAPVRFLPVQHFRAPGKATREAPGRKSTARSCPGKWCMSRDSWEAGLPIS